MLDKTEQQKTLKELHEEANKDLEVFDLPFRCERDPNFKPEPHVETYKEWLEEINSKTLTFKVLKCYNFN